MARIAVAAVFGAACTGSVVNVEVAADPPDFIAYRDGASSWKTPKPIAGGKYAAHHYDLEVTSDYELVVVSIDPDSGAAASTELRATPADAMRWYVDYYGAHDIAEAFVPDVFVADVFVGSASEVGLCTPPDQPSPIPGSIIASGSMAQPGRVSIGGQCTLSASASWTFRLPVVPGMHDIIATDPVGTPSPRVAITRGLMLDSPTTLPLIDLAADGQLLDSATITVVNTGTDPGDTVALASRLVLYAGSDGALLASGTGTATSRSHDVPIVPTSLLQTGDVQLLWIGVTDYTNASRQAATRHPTETPLFEYLTAPIIDITTDTGVDTASWSEPLSTRIQAVDVHTMRVDAAFNVTSEAITATKPWLDAHRATSLGFDTDIPGYDPTWLVDVTQMHWTDFTVRANEGSIGYWTTRSEN